MKWRRWGFRGQAKSEWDLSAKLERSLKNRFGLDLNKAGDFEFYIYREFLRQIHRYDKVVDTNDVLECLSLMQHYGAPTRLIDWTYSFWVGLFFAIEDAFPQDTCSVWAIDIDWLRKKARECMPISLKNRTETSTKGRQIVSEIFGCDRLFVWPSNPLRLDERLVVQQGIFTAARDITKTFMENLVAVSEPNEFKHNFVKINIECNSNLLKEALTQLHKMNVNRRTLFPGLEGFAQDLKNRFVMEHFFQGVRHGNDSIWKTTFD